MIPYEPNESLLDFSYGCFKFLTFSSEDLTVPSLIFPAEEKPSAEDELSEFFYSNLFIYAYTESLLELL